MRAVLVVGALFASLAVAEAAEPRRRVAVLEYRAGVSQGADAAQRTANRLKKIAALDLVDPAEAHRAIATVDADLARCAGDPLCTARIGGRLDVDEVLVVALSQLGDLVLTLQRIDVPTEKLETQIGNVIPAGGELSDEQLDGWLRQLYPPEVFKRYGYISVKTNVDGARVTLNGGDRGLTPLEGKLRVLAPKPYRVELEKKGYTPFSAKIDVVPDSTVEVNAVLPEIQPPPSWYKRWYVWAVVGGLVAGGVATTAVLLTRPDDLHARGSITLPSP